MHYLGKLVCRNFTISHVFYSDKLRMFVDFPVTNWLSKQLAYLLLLRYLNSIVKLSSGIMRQVQVTLSENALVLNLLLLLTT